ncbi:MAG: hypothetical protein RIR73_2706 [Chloroflexota bacterium]
MKSSRLFAFIFPIFIILSACATPNPEASQVVLPIILITSAPDATATPTPFQPSIDVNTPTAASVNAPTLTPEIILPSLIPSSTNTLLPPPTATAPIEPFPTAQAVDPATLPFISNNDTVNFLLIGSDRRPTGTSHRTDTLLIAMVWYREGQVSLISIPRDLWIDIPTVGMQRINTAYQSGESSGYPGGGMGLLKDTILQNLGIRIDHAAMVDFDGFRRIVDTFGGIDVPIACTFTDWRLISPELDQNDENNWWLYTIGPGLVHMDGDLALWYARSRSKSSDFDRGRRQQEVIRTLFQKALQSDTFNKIPQLYTDFSSTVVTDMGLADMLNLAPYAVNFTNANIRSYYIRPPYVQSWVTPGGAAVLLPQESLSQMLIEAATLSTFATTRESIVIEIQNGSHFDTMETLVASRLNYAGFETITSAADNRDYANTVLIDLTAAQDPNQRQTILNVLGAYSANVLSIPDPNSKVHYRLIIGAEYDACFRPEDLAH